MSNDNQELIKHSDAELLPFDTGKVIESDGKQYKVASIDELINSKAHVGSGTLDLFKAAPPKMKLKFLLGIWMVPWVIDKPARYELRDKIKVWLAHDPEGILAEAYQMGVEDGASGKLNPDNRQGKVTKKWFVDRGLEVPKKEAR